MTKVIVFGKVALIGCSLKPSSTISQGTNFSPFTTNIAPANITSDAFYGLVVSGGSAWLTAGKNISSNTTEYFQILGMIP